MVGWLLATYWDGLSSSLSYLPQMVDYRQPATASIVFWPLPWLLCAVSAIYVGGMILNDAFDAAWDAQHRSNRPIPTGVISKQAALAVGLVLLLGGAIGAVAVRAVRMNEFTEVAEGRLSSGVGPVAIIVGALVAGVLIYNRWHKGVRWAPAVMGLCRALLPLLGVAVASVTLAPYEDTKLGLFLFLGAATLWGHTFGLTWVARHEATDGTPPAWTAWAIFIAPLPLVLATGLLSTGGGLWAVLPLSAFVLWIIFSNRQHALPAGVGGRVSDRLAASPFLDYLILGRVFLWSITLLGAPAAVLFHPTHVANLVPFCTLALLGPFTCFGLTLLFRRWIPQT